MVDTDGRSRNNGVARPEAKKGVQVVVHTEPSSSATARGTYDNGRIYSTSQGEMRIR